MLPHLLHTTTRAAAVVQNQTQAFRNVLQLQSSGPSSGSGSSRGNGPSSGGSKFHHAGSKFHAGLNSAGRAVTQAHTVTSNDGTLSQSDDQDEIPVRRPVRPSSTAQRKRVRMRSASVSLGVAERNERGLKMGVLQSVQIHARAHHAFASSETLAAAKQRLLAEHVAETTQSPLLVRRNSTSAPLSPLLTPVADPSLPAPPPEQPGFVALSGAEPKAARPAAEGKALKAAQKIETKRKVVEAAARAIAAKAEAVAQAEIKAAEEAEARRVVEAAERAAKQAVEEERQTRCKGYTDRIEFLSQHYTNQSTIADIGRVMLADKKANPRAEDCNIILQGLEKTRKRGDPLWNVIKFYGSMLEHFIVPNVRTYELLIIALTDRDHSLITTSQGNEAKQEDNYASALSLFQGILAVNGAKQLEQDTFSHLIRSAAHHSDVQSAELILSAFETARPTDRSSGPYIHTITAFSNAGNIGKATEIFERYREHGKKGLLIANAGEKASQNRAKQIRVWNAMIEAHFRANKSDDAVALVLEMVESTSGNQFTTAQVPVPTSSTFTTVIAGFISISDMSSALQWFERLLSEERKAPVDPFQGLEGKVMRPDSVAWHLILDGLAAHGMVEDLNRLYTRLRKIQVEDELSLRPVDHLIVSQVNLANLEGVDQEKALSILEFLHEDLVFAHSNGLDVWQLAVPLCHAYLSRGEFVAPSRLLEQLTRGLMTRSDALPEVHVVTEVQRILHRFIESVARHLENGVIAEPLPFPAAFTIMKYTRLTGIRLDTRFAQHLIPSYTNGRFFGTVPYAEFALGEWDTLLRHAAYLERNALDGNPAQLSFVLDAAGQGRVSAVLQDVAAHGVEFGNFSTDIQSEVLELLAVQFQGEEGVKGCMARLGPSYEEAAAEFWNIRQQALVEPPVLQSPFIGAAEHGSLTPTQHTEPLQQYTPPPTPPQLAINGMLTKNIDRIIPLSTAASDKDKIGKAFYVVEKNLRMGLVPSVNTFSRLIALCGRSGDLEKVQFLYAVSQDVFQLLPAKEQLDAWASIEDNMLIALAHAGQVEAAHVHRARLLNQGYAPSADSYGVLIQQVRDTTDDTLGGLSLFQEALERGVKPNIYLYNNIISKLAKARKADYALELFQQMKAEGVQPSSITYGAIIGACARVGDVKSAENLFYEMVHSRGFRPRVPPFNTMMQLYTTTKPNQGSALYYYGEMRRLGISPSAHTYKLLLDTYGSIEPVNLHEMESVFKELQADRRVELNGQHFASLINAYGCVAKNLDKAIAVFESISSTPRAPAPDAVVFEAIINVIVAHKRTDLIPVYINKMSEAGVHMTAYIANFLIKGYANVGEMDKARDLFESLLDPPTGIAAPNNHAPHNPAESPEVPLMEPVYREPSTWESMVRAELGAGNRDAALELLQRLQTRQYPEAVYNRISGILTDHSAIVV